MERAVALRESLRDTAKDELTARDALAQPFTAAGAAEQKHAAERVRADSKDLAQAVEAARAAVEGNALGQAWQAAEQARNTKAPEVLERRAAKALAGEREPQKDAAAAKDAADAAKDLAAAAQKAEDAAAAVNKDLGNAAQQLNGDAAQELRKTVQQLAGGKSGAGRSAAN